MMKKRIIAFDLEPQVMQEGYISRRSPHSKARKAYLESQERYYVDPSRPPRPVAHENIEDYMQISAPSKAPPPIKESRSKKAKENIFKSQVEALLSGQRSHTLRPLRNKLVQIALSLAENAKIWQQPTFDQKRAECEQAVSENTSSALNYVPVVSPSGYINSGRHNPPYCFDYGNDPLAPTLEPSTFFTNVISDLLDHISSIATISPTSFKPASSSHTNRSLHRNDEVEAKIAYSDNDSTAKTSDIKALGDTFGHGAVEAYVHAQNSSSSALGSYNAAEPAFSAMNTSDASIVAQSADITTPVTTSSVDEANSRLAIKQPLKRQRGSHHNGKPEVSAFAGAGSLEATAQANGLATLDNGQAGLAAHAHANTSVQHATAYAQSVDENTDIFAKQSACSDLATAKQRVHPHIIGSEDTAFASEPTTSAAAQSAEIVALAAKYAASTADALSQETSSSNKLHARGTATHTNSSAICTEHATENAEVLKDTVSVASIVRANSSNADKALLDLQESASQPHINGLTKDSKAQNVVNDANSTARSNASELPIHAITKTGSFIVHRNPVKMQFAKLLARRLGLKAPKTDEDADFIIRHGTKATKKRKKRR